jgi:hypothetical protein
VVFRCSGYSGVFGTVIYAVGLQADRTIAHFARFARKFGHAVQILELASIAESGWSFSLPAGYKSWVTSLGCRIDLDPAAGYYCRLTDLSSAIEGEREARDWRGMLLGLSSWLETIPGSVVNRPGHSCDNSSKPLHEAVLRRMGFQVPASLTSSDGVRLQNFCKAAPSVVKAISGIRADCRRVEPEEFEDFSPEYGPVHLQHMVQGWDLRVHVIEGTIHAQIIESNAIDYRIADSETVYREVQLSIELADRLVSCSRALGLTFAGWDFKVTPEQEFWCLEVNPMPGYHSYDLRLDGRVTETLCAALVRGTTAKPYADATAFANRY